MTPQDWGDLAFGLFVALVVIGGWILVQVLQSDRWGWTAVDVLTYWLPVAGLCAFAGWMTWLAASLWWPDEWYRVLFAAAVVWWLPIAVVAMRRGNTR